MKPNFSNATRKIEGFVMMGGQNIPASESFRYLVYINKQEGEPGENIIHRVKVGGKNQRYRVFCVIIICFFVKK